MTTRRERAIKYQELLDKKPAAENAVSSIAGIIGVSVGLKVDAEEYATDIMCFRVYYKKGEAPDNIETLIPQQVDNIPMQAVEMPADITPSAKVDKNKYRPLYGGSYIKSANSFGSGTLGCFVTDDESDDIFLLSNYHVLMMDGEEEGHQIAQPGFRCEAWPCRCGEIAKLARGAFHQQNVDCAVASLSNGQENRWTNKVLALGYISSIPLNDNKEPIDPRTRERIDVDTGKNYVPLLPGETVFKRGVSSKKTEGIVVDVTAPATINFITRQGFEPGNFVNQILIAPKKDHKPFTRKGDSGSVIVNHLNQVVGLYFADNERRNENGRVTRKATRSFANPIQDVLSALRISIPDTGTLNTLLLRRIGDQPEQPAVNAFDNISQLIEQDVEGPALMDAFTRFRPELIQLVQHNREVKVAWHRCQGPSFVAHFARKKSETVHTVPHEIDGVSFQRLLTKMSVVLEKNGSPGLAAAIAQYTATVMGLFRTFFHSLQPKTVKP